MTDHVSTGYGWSIKDEYNLAKEQHPDEVIPREERTALDTRRKQRSRGGEPELPKSEWWWEGVDRKRQEVLSDPAVLKALLEADLEAEGATLKAALATMKRGRIAGEDRAIHDLFARFVAKLHERGAKFVDIASAIGRDRRAVEHLVSQGQGLRHACSRHEAFRSDCPSCLRHAPDRAVGGSRASS